MRFVLFTVINPNEKKKKKDRHSAEPAESIIYFQPKNDKDDDQLC